MKKLFLLLLPGALLLAGNAEAQLQKGTKYWGATISTDGHSLHSESLPSVESKSNNHNIAPSIQAGWMFKDNRMFGLRLSSVVALRKGISEQQGNKNENVSNYTSVGLSPFIRHYKSINEKWAIFLQTGFEGAYFRTKDKYTNITEHENGYGLGIYVLPGISYWVTPRFALESDVNVLSLALNYTSMEDVNNFNFNAGVTSGIQSYFGIRASWYLQKSN